MLKESSNVTTRPFLSFWKRARCLLVALAALFCVIYGLAPLPLEFFAPLREYARVVDDTGIAPGALYYTDVPQSNEAEMNNRDSIRYFTDKRVGPAVLAFLFSGFSLLLWVLIRRK